MSARQEVQYVMIPLYAHYYFAHYILRLLQPQGKCYKGTKDKQEQLHIWILLSNNFGPPVLFPIFNMRPVAYLPRQFPFETKDGEEQCVFSFFPKVPSIWLEVPFFPAPKLLSLRKVFQHQGIGYFIQGLVGIQLFCSTHQNWWDGTIFSKFTSFLRMHF